jgi:hypothetical protein
MKLTLELEPDKRLTISIPDTNSVPLKTMQEMCVLLDDWRESLEAEEAK